MRNPIIKAGDKYNKLTVIRFDHRDKKSNQFWLFECNCGNEKVIRIDKVKDGTTKSCGCLRREIKKTHGMAKTPVYLSWRSMKDRCLNKNHQAFDRYGGRGITVCKRWMRFENFYEDMGDRPKGKTLDRINNNGNYEPSNCRWATPRQQANNRRNNRFLTYNGKTQTISQWAREIGINRYTLSDRIIYYKWSVKRALNK